MRFGHVLECYRRAESGTGLKTVGKSLRGRETRARNQEAGTLGSSPATLLHLTLTQPLLHRLGIIVPTSQEREEAIG